MQVGHHEITFKVILHFYIITYGSKIIAEVQKTCWPNPAHYYFFITAHKDNEDKETSQLAVRDFPFIIIKNRLPTATWQLPTIIYICRMEINDALVDKLANLARLRFEDTEKAAIKDDLQRMIRFVEKLNELDTTGENHYCTLLIM